ncbi:MAG: MFS transporter [Arthrobacter sp.]|jgi:DHA2 family multidrug resistance protein-like MFS transporter|nr:MFS transporter [Arthrobacter sp.]
MSSAQPPHPFSPKRRWAALSILVLAVLLLAIDGTVLYLAVPSLTADLQPSATQLLWIGDVYSLALGGLLVTMGVLADRIGRKRLLLLGSALFGVASLVAAFAPSAEWLIAARVLLGVAGATLMPSTLSLIRNIFTDAKERTRAIAIWSAAAGGGAALGPLVGGVLLEHFWWGSVFLINVPVVLVLVVAGFFLLPESKDPNPGRFDLVSAALSMAAIVPLVYAVKHTVQSGVDALGAVCLLAGLAFGWWFIRRQQRLAAPMIDVSLFKVPAFAGSVLSQFIAVFALTGLLFFFSQYLQLGRGYTPLQAGLAELPATLASIVVVLLVGWFLAKLGAGRTIAAGLALTGGGLIAIAIAEGAQSYLWLGLALIPVGLGVGLAQTVTVDAVVSAVPPAKAGSASAISETSYELGVALGIAVLGSLMTALYRLNLPAGLGGANEHGVRESLATAMTILNPASAEGEAARHAFTSAMQTTSIVAAVITLVGAVIAFKVIPSPKLVGERVAADH